MHEVFGIKGVLSIYKIEQEWADDEKLFQSLWLPKTEQGHDGRWRIIEDAKISDDVKSYRLARDPIENIITNAGISLLLTDLSVANQSQQFPITQILSIGNGAIVGVTRSDTSVIGDGFTTGSRKAPSSYQQVGLQTTIITNYATTDANGSWTNAGFYGYNVGGSANATTTTGTGSLMTHAMFPFVKNSNGAYAISYVFTVFN